MKNPKILLLCAAVCCALPALSQTYSATSITISSGGTSMASGAYSASVSLGQPITTDSLNGGQLTFTAGFWSLDMTNSGAPNPGGNLTLTPSYDLATTGVVGGPFYFHTVYYLSNSGPAAVNWALSHSADWLSMPLSGALAPGTATGLGWSINGNANNLPVGTYSDTLVFKNADSGEVFATRTVTLTVTTGLTITGNDLFSTGSPGGPFDPSSTTYTLRNLESTPVSWTAANDTTWVIASPSNGTLAAGASTTVTVSLTSTANSLMPGIYANTVSFVNTTDGRGSQTRAVGLSIGSALTASWESGLPTPYFASGYEGGPFTPASTGCIVSNSSANSINWSAGSTANWLTISPASGALPPFSSARLTVSINTNASILPGGTSYSSDLLFTNAVHNAPEASLWANVAISASAPVITMEPGHNTVAPGGTAAFSVSATGLSTIYQWYKDGSLILGATNNTLRLTNVSAADYGHYSARASNSGGFADSSIGTLALLSMGYNPTTIIGSSGAISPGPRLTLTAKWGDQYRIDYKDSLEATSWSVLSYITGQNGSSALSDTNGGNKRFYRAVYSP